MATATAVQRGPVRISLPASVAYNVDLLKESIAGIVERLGCTRCFSGADCVFQLERDWVVNEKLELVARAEPDPEPWVTGPDPTPWRAVAGPDPTPWKMSKISNVSLSAKVAFDLERIQEVVARVAGKLGHAQCFSGFDIGFGLEERIVLGEKGRIVG